MLAYLGACDMLYITQCITPLCTRKPALCLWEVHLKGEVSSSVPKAYVIIVVQTETGIQRIVCKRKKEVSITFGCKGMSLFKEFSYTKNNVYQILQEVGNCLNYQQAFPICFLKSICFSDLFQYSLRSEIIKRPKLTSLCIYDLLLSYSLFLPRFPETSYG